MENGTWSSTPTEPPTTPSGITRQISREHVSTWKLTAEAEFHAGSIDCRKCLKPIWPATGEPFTIMRLFKRVREHIRDYH